MRLIPMRMIPCARLFASWWMRESSWLLLPETTARTPTVKRSTDKYIHPATSPQLLPSAASNSYGTNHRADDEVTSYSSRGPTRSFWTDQSGVKHYDNLIKPDLVAPGNKIISAAAYNNFLLVQNPQLDADVSTKPASRMMYMSGSSMSAPIAAGAAALLVQLNPKLRPNLIKTILMYTAQPLAGAQHIRAGCRTTQRHRCGATCETGKDRSVECDVSACSWRNTFEWAGAGATDHHRQSNVYLVTGNYSQSHIRSQAFI